MKKEIITCDRCSQEAGPAAAVIPEKHLCLQCRAETVDNASNVTSEIEPLALRVGDTIRNKVTQQSYVIVASIDFGRGLLISRSEIISRKDTAKSWELVHVHETQPKA